MFLVKPRGVVLKGSKTISQHCANCNNDADFVIWREPFGFQVGTIFSRTNMVGMKKYKKMKSTPRSGFFLIRTNVKIILLIKN